MPRRYGYSKQGKRYFDHHAWGERGRINVIGALLGATLLTVSLFQGTINGDVFEAWVAGDLLPKLPPKSVIVMDNAAFHKTQRVEMLFEQTEHTLCYLPSYSPDMNTIEHKWAQAKSIRRTQQCSVSELFLNNKL